MAANYLFRSPDRGDSWVTISPDLTRGIDRNKLPMRGAVPDSLELGRNEGTAEFSNISTIDESPMKAGLLVVGTDDGLIQVTRDGGKSWAKSDHFPGVPDTTYVSRVVFSRANEGTIYATLDGHRSNDFKPYVVKSTDFGKTWTSIASDLPDGGSVQVIREHPRQPNLLFVGTEFGVFFTIDGGGHWTQLKSGIPGVPVHDIQIQPRMNDLVVGTHGRGVYILDDLAPLEHLAQAKQAQSRTCSRFATSSSIQPNATRNSGHGDERVHGTEPGAGCPNRVRAQRRFRRTQRRRSRFVDATGTVIRQMAANNKQGLVSPVLGHARWSAADGNRDRHAAAGDRRRRGPRRSRRCCWWRWRCRRIWRRTWRRGRVLPRTSRHYKARLTITSAAGAPTVLEQSFTLRKDPMVTLAESELKQLNAFRVSIAAFQRTLRAKQAQTDTIERTFAEARRAADASLSKLPPETKAKLAALTKEMSEIIAQIGAPPGAGRGGRGGGGGAGGAGGAAGAGGVAAGAARGGRGGGGRAAAAARQLRRTLRAAGGRRRPRAERSTIRTRCRRRRRLSPFRREFNSLTEMLNVSFAVSDEQRKTLQALPADLQKQADRVTKVATDELPALIKALNDAGIQVKAGGSN